MKFIAFGGGHHIGASAYFLELNGVRLLVDAGLEPGKVRTRCDFNSMARLAGYKSAADLDAVLLTHAHLDHSGGLLDLLTQAPAVRVIFHPHTGALVQRLFQRMPGLKDAYGRKKGFERLLNAVQENKHRAYHEPIEWKGRNGQVTITLLDAGHIPGSASFRIEGGGERVLVTGDFNDQSSLFQTGTGENPAYSEVPIDTLVLEGTYAGRHHPEGTDATAARVVPTVQRVTRRGGLVLFPVFAMGRAQEVLGHLAAGLRSGQLDPVPLWLDPPVTAWCQQYAEFYPAFQEVMELLQPLRKRAVDEGLINPVPAGPGISLVSAGMLQDGTPAARTTLQLLPDPRNAIVFTSFQARGTLGAKLLKMPTDDQTPRILVQPTTRMNIEAELLSIHLSGHADHSGLLRMVQQTSPRRVVLVHRHEDNLAVDQLGLDLPGIEVLLPSDGQVVQ